VPSRKSLETGKSRNVFGKKLRTLRLNRKLSVRATAAKLQAHGWDLGETSLGHIEAGRRTITDMELMRILRVLGARLSDLE
jgi:transcriptional regulator with XRE-family HTH domain